MEKMLVVGASGLLGHDVCHLLKNDFVVTGTYRAHPFEEEGVEAVRMDIGAAEDIEAVVRRVRPAVLLMCAAMTGVDACEEAPQVADAGVPQVGTVVPWQEAVPQVPLSMSGFSVPFAQFTPPRAVASAYCAAELLIHTSTLRFWWIPEGLVPPPPTAVYPVPRAVDTLWVELPWQ